MHVVKVFLPAFLKGFVKLNLTYAVTKLNVHLTSKKVTLVLCVLQANNLVV